MLQGGSDYFGILNAQINRLIPGPYGKAAGCQLEDSNIKYLTMEYGNSSAPIETSLDSEI